MTKGMDSDLGPIETQKSAVETQVEKLQENARLAMESALVESERRIEIALEHALSAFLMAPAAPGNLRFLLEICAEKDRSPFELKIDKKIEAALADSDACDALSIWIGGHVSQRVLEGKNEDYIPEINWLNKIIATERRPFALASLANIYFIIGRHPEGLDLLREAKEADPALIELYLQMAQENGRFDLIIEHAESRKEGDEIGEEESIIIRRAYAHRIVGLEEGGEPTDIVHYGQYADSVPEPPHQRSLKKAFELFHRARTVEDEEKEQRLLREAIGEIVKTQRALSMMPQNAEATRLYIESGILLTEIFSHNTSHATSEEDLKMPIDIGWDLVTDDELELTRGDRAAAAYNTAKLMHRQYELGKKEELLPFIKKLFELSIHLNWVNEDAYLRLANINEIMGDLDTAYKIRIFARHIIPMQDLIQFDVNSKPVDLSGTYSLKDPQERPEEADVIITLEEVFRPIFKALEAYARDFEAFLKSKLPPGATLSSRIKSVPSVLLKMLKTETISVADITDMVGFRVLTEDETQALRLYEEVKSYFADDPKPKEWKTLGSPTAKNYRSLDITGFPPGGDFWIQVQIRPKAVDEEINASQASHEYYKVDFGKKLADLMDADPLKYLMLFQRITENLFLGHQKVTQAEEELSLKELLEAFNAPV